MNRQVHPELRASWWLRKGSVAGAARPGFGRVPWRELGPVEAALLTWLGSRHGESAPLADLPGFFDEYVAKRRAFGREGTAEFREELRATCEPDRLRDALSALAERTAVHGRVEADAVRVDATLVRAEAELMREAGLEVLVSLMEREPDAEVAGAGLEVHHFALDDMLPPRREQVERLAGLLGDCEADGRAVVVHCLAGIGRTTTMLAGAALLRGSSLDQISRAVAEANPGFRRLGPQWEFLRDLAGSPGGTPRALQ